MGFVTPVGLAFAALSIPILVLYMLRLRRREVLVSSTFLWQRLLRDREANTPWQRLRRNLLLLLQLLVLALLALALARPFLSAPAIATGDVVILLDASASMQATDVRPTRFDAARRAAREVVDGLGSGDTATLIAAGPQPTILAAATRDRAALLRALGEAVPSDGPADWEAACTLAAASLAGANQAQVVLISDGAIGDTLPPLPGDVRFVRIGEREENLAVVALAVRDGGMGPQAFLRVANFGGALAQVPLVFRADGVLLDVHHLAVPPSGTAALTLDDLPYDTALLEARLTASDSFPLDDVAWAVGEPPDARRILLVTAGNLFLERALEVLPGMQLTLLTPDQPLPSEPYDLVVYDGLVTDTLPPGNGWVIGPYGHASSVFTDTTIARQASDDPLLRYVDLDDVHVRRAWRVQPPPGARVLVEAEGGPLLFVVERPEGRLAALTFDLHESDLPLQVAFPILVANLARWLLPPPGATEVSAIHPGDPVSIRPLPDAQRAVIIAPDGGRYELALDRVLPVFPATDRLGVYQVVQFGAGDAHLRSDLFAVNLFDADESDIGPREVIRVGEAELRVASPQEKGQREFWPWLGGAALGVLGVEWFVYHRASTAPGDKGTGRQGDTWREVWKRTGATKGKR